MQNKGPITLSPAEVQELAVALNKHSAFCDEKAGKLKQYFDLLDGELRGGATEDIKAVVRTVKQKAEKLIEINTKQLRQLSLRYQSFLETNAKKDIARTNDDLAAKKITTKV